MQLPQLLLNAVLWYLKTLLLTGVFFKWSSEKSKHDRDFEY